MQERHLYEYAVIRVMPKVERCEFMNVGVVLYCKDFSFLKVLFMVDQHRLLALCRETDLNLVQNHLSSFENICIGNSLGGEIALLDTASRFRWVTAKRSTIIQTSEVHPGLCTNPEETLGKLYKQLVLT